MKTTIVVTFDTEAMKFNQLTDVFHRELIKLALTKHHGNATRTAATLGMETRSLRYRLDALGIDLAEFRSK